MITQLCRIALLLLFFNSSLFAADYYWVGNAGNWSDLSHWATTSGGSTKHTVLPGVSDNVFFDANSFTLPNQQVTITFGATCRNMNWTGATNSPKIYSFFDDLNVYGSIIIPSTVVRDFLGNIRLKGTSGSHVIDLANLPLSASNNEVLFVEGVGGTWTLQSGFTLYRINLTGGTLNTNGHTVTTSIISSNGSNSRSFTLGASAINTATWDMASSTGLSINAGTSIITTTFGFYGANAVYNNLTINGNVEVRANNTFNTITVNAGGTLRLKDGSTQIISNLVSNGTAGNPITIRSTVAGVAATLSKSSGSVSVANMRIQDNIATGGATFSAPAGSVDLGNVTGWNITAIEPTTQVTSAQIRKLVVNAIDLQWTNGNGANRIVLARQGGAVTAAPTDLTSYTTGSFGTGSQVGTGNYVVYIGNSDRATITGLAANTVYHFAVYEFNGTGAGANFLTTTPALRNATTLPNTAVIISNNPATVCGGTYYDTGGGGLYNYSNNESFTQTLTPATAGSKLRLSFNDFFTSNAADVLKIYDGADVNAPLLGSFSEDDVPGVISAKNAAGKLTVSFVSDNLFQSTGWDAAISCFTLEAEPTANVSGWGGSSTAISTTITINTKGNGQNRLLLVKQGSAVNFNPVDGVEYAVNNNFGAGTNLGGTGTYAVYKGDDNSITVNNLLPGTSYHFSIIEYNGANTSTNYRVPGTTFSRTTTSMASQPTQPSSNIVIGTRAANSVNLSLTRGNGVSRLIVMKKDAPVDAVPQDGIFYSTAGNFSTSPELGNGNKVVLNTTSDLALIIGLEPLSTYYIAVFEFNGSSAGVTNYLPTLPATNSFTTMAVEPTIIAGSQLTVISAGFDFFEVKWTKGNGQKRLITVGESGSALVRPVDGVTYSANAVFGQGQALASGRYVVADGDLDQIKVTGLSPGKTYTFEVIEYNGSGTEINYRTSGIATSSVQTLVYKPSVQASNVVISDVTASAMRISWQRGNGSESLVVIKEGIAPILDIKDSSFYSMRFLDNASGTNIAYFGDGDDLKDGSMVVFSWSGSSVLVKNLNPSKTYHVAVIEYNRPYDGKNYIHYHLTNNPARASASTLAGQNYYWVGGTGMWSDHARHWATSSGGSSFHSSVPSSADNVIFDANSLLTDSDTIYFDLRDAYAKNFDLSAVTKKAVLAPKNQNCWEKLNVYGSFKLANSVRINVTRLYFRSTESGNTIDFGEQRSISSLCQNQVIFNGLGGTWSMNKPFSFFYLSLARGELTLANSEISMIGFYTKDQFSPSSSNLPIKLNLPNTKVKTYSWKGSPGLVVSGGSIEFTSSYSSGSVLEAANGKYSKIIFGSQSPPSLLVTGHASIDSLVIVGPRDVNFEAGKTIQVGNLIAQGDSTKVINLKSSVTGQAFIIEKTEGSLITNYVNIKDNIARGGAVFTAKNGLNLGNVTGWTFTTPSVYSPAISSRDLFTQKAYYSDAKFRWSNGNGTGRIVVIREYDKPIRYPLNQRTYTANSSFGLGNDLGDGNFVIYKGNLDSAAVTGLTPGKRYRVAVFEFNEWQDSIKYRQANPAILTLNMLKTGDVIFAGNTLSVSRTTYYDDGGNGRYRFVNYIAPPVIQTIAPQNAGDKVAVLFTSFSMAYQDTLYVYNGANTNAPLVGKYNYRTITGEPIISTSVGGQLTFKLVINRFQTSDSDRNGWVAELYTIGSVVAEPTVQPSALTITNRTSNSVNLKMTKGNGAGRVVVVRSNSAVNRIPLDGLSVSTAPFEMGTNLGLFQFVVFAGDQEEVEIQGLQPNSQYHFAVFEYNGSGNAINYLTENPARNNATTLISTPSLVSQITHVSNITISSATINLARGNGDQRLILLRKWKPVEASPELNKYYSHSLSYGSGSFLGDSTYVVLSTYGLTNFTITNLEPLTRYYAKVFEFNSQGDQVAYLLNSTSTASFFTDGPKITLKALQQVSFCPNDEIIVPFQATEGYSTGNRYRLQLSDPTGSFATNTLNTLLKDTAITSLSGSIRAKIPNLVSSSNQYRIRILTTSPISVSDSLRTLSLTGVPDITFTREGNTLTATQDNNLQWLKDGIAIAGATSKVFEVPNDPGAYAVRVNNAQCFKTSGVYLITALEEGFVKTIHSIYPNPAKNILTIGCEEDSGSFVVFDLQGRIQQQGKFSSSTFSINVEFIPTGMYLIRLTTEKSVYQGSFVK